MELLERCALVTGASRGIGKAIAIELARMGAGLMLVARNETHLNNVRSEIERMGGTAVILAVDLAKEESWQILQRRLAEEKTHIDILINNAGIYTTDYIDVDQTPGWDSASSQAWQQTLAVNLTAPFQLCRILAPDMVQKGWGRIVNISSIAGKKAETFGSAYSASKFGLIGLTQSLALELARHGVTVNAVCPGWVETDMAKDQINDPEWCRLNNIDLEESLDIARLSVPQMRFIQ